MSLKYPEKGKKYFCRDIYKKPGGPVSPALNDQTLQQAMNNLHRRSTDTVANATCTTEVSHFSWGRYLAPTPRFGKLKMEPRRTQRARRKRKSLLCARCALRGFVLFGAFRDTLLRKMTGGWYFRSFDLPQCTAMSTRKARPGDLADVVMGGSGNETREPDTHKGFFPEPARFQPLHILCHLYSEAENEGTTGKRTS